MSRIEAWHTSDAWRAELKDDDAPMHRRARLLDRETDPHPILNALLDLALAQILLTCDGATANLNAKIAGGGHHGSRALTSALAEDVERLATRYGGARTHRQRLAVIVEAQQEAIRLRHAPDRSKMRGTLEWREAIVNDPRPYRVVAHLYGTSPATVCRLKKGNRGA